MPRYFRRPGSVRPASSTSTPLATASIPRIPRVPTGGVVLSWLRRICPSQASNAGSRSCVRGGRPRTAEGQALAEFAIVVPLILILFVAVADFGRVFGAMITLEAATRDAAEATANEYLANPPGPLASPAPGSNQAYYDTLHTYGANVVCDELRGLPNTNYDPGTKTCPDMPVVVVCIHDGEDSGCGNPAQPGTGGIASQCTDFTPSATSSQDATHQRWVEVRTCYHFTPILAFPLFQFGEYWLQRTRDFTIPCYFVLGTSECG